MATQKWNELEEAIEILGNDELLIDSAGIPKKITRDNLNIYDKSEVDASLSEKYDKSGGTVTGDIIQTETAGLTVVGASTSHPTNTGNVSSTLHQSQVNASTNGIASAVRSQINASSGCTAESVNSQINASSSSNAGIGSSGSQINASLGCTISAANCQINAARNILNDRSYSSTWGYSPTTGALEENQTIRLEGIDGHAFFKGNVRIGENSITSPSDQDEALRVVGDITQASATGLTTIAGSISHPDNTGSVTTLHTRQVNASQDSTASAGNSQVNASQNSTASGARSQVNASFESTASQTRSQVNASSRTINNTEHSSVWGYNAAGEPLLANQQIRLESIGGIGRFKGGTTTTGFDIAEYFESKKGEAIDTGTLVMLKGEKIINAEGDDFIGAISETAGYIGNAVDFCWKGRYLRNEFGGYIWEEVPDMDYELQEDETEKDRPNIRVRKENPDFNVNEEYISREHRKEWNVVGMLGQLYIRTGESVQSGDYITSQNGLGIKSNNKTRLRVMSVKKEYDNEYGIAFCIML